MQTTRFSLWSFCVLAFLFTSSCKTDQFEQIHNKKPIDVSGLVQDAEIEDAALLIVRLEDGQEWQAGGDRIEKRFIPASTSKIPHTLIAIDAGWVTGPEQVFQWDGVKRFSKNWNKSQSFAAAFQNSTVWIFQKVIGEAPRDELVSYLQAFNYGNAKIGDEAQQSKYWLEGPLAISAREQIDFLIDFVEEELPLKESTYKLSKKVMLEETGIPKGMPENEVGSSWALFGKTGWGANLSDSADIGWYVGWVEKTNNDKIERFIFAFNMDMHNPNADLRKRKSIVRTALKRAGALPSDVN